jgi:hypothetical protein
VIGGIHTESTYACTVSSILRMLLIRVLNIQ